MIKNMDLKFSVVKSRGGKFRFLDFAGGKFITGFSPAINAGKDNANVLPYGTAFGIKVSALITGAPERWIEPLFSILKHNKGIKAYLSEEAYSVIRCFWNKKAETALAAGKNNEAQEIKELAGKLIHAPYGETISEGRVSMVFFKNGEKLGSSAVKISFGEDSALIKEITSCPDLLKPVCGDDKQLKADVCCLSLPCGFRSENSFQNDSRNIDYLKMSEEISSAKKNLGLFFIPADVFEIPLVVKALNIMQDKGLIQPDIRICPIGSEAKDILSLYEENGVKLRYASAYLRNSVQPASLPREANCGFRIFITPGKDLSDTRNSFSANLFSLIKGNPLASVICTDHCQPASFPVIPDNEEGKKCRIFSCGLLAAPSLKDIEETGCFSHVVMSGDDMSACEQAASQFKNIPADVLSDENSNISFFRDKENRMSAVHGKQTHALVLLMSEEMEERGLDSALALIEKLEKAEQAIPGNAFPGKYGKVFLLSASEIMPLAERMCADFLENAGVPAELIPVSEKNSENENCAALHTVSSLSEIMENYNDFSIFLGGSLILDSWAAIFAYLFGKKAWYFHKDRIFSLYKIPLPFEERKLDAYWGSIREIAENGRQDLINSVPPRLLSAALEPKEQHFTESGKSCFVYSPYGILLNSYCKAKGKKCPVSAAKLFNTDNNECTKDYPEALVFTVGNSLIDNYININASADGDEPRASAEALLGLISSDSANAYQNCCYELKTLFSLPDPALLKNCRKAAFIVQDTFKGKIISQAFENFFKNINIKTETLFVEPFEDNSEYGLNDLGLHNMSEALKDLKLKHKKLLFLLCGGDTVLNWHVNLAAMLFKDIAYCCSSGDDAPYIMPSLPLEPDMSEYSSLRKFMQIVLDLNLASRHEMLPDEFKDKILRKTGHGFLFTALQPILETLHFLKNPSEQEHKAIPGSSVLMAGGENGRERQPFFIVRKKSVLP